MLSHVEQGLCMAGHVVALIVIFLTLILSPRAAVLVLAGTELTLFLVAGTVLCFGFSVRMMLITLMF